MSRPRCPVSWLALLVLMLASAVPGPLRAAAAPAAGSAAPHPGAGPADLVVANRHAATLRASIGSLTPAERVEGARARIERLTESDLESPVTAEPTRFAGQDAYAIRINGRHILALVEADVDHAAGERLADVASAAAAHLDAARLAYLELHRGEHVARKAAHVLAATLAFWLLWHLLARARRRVRARIAALAPRRHPALAIRGLDVSDMLLHATQRIAAAGYYAAIAFGAYVWAAYVLGQFAYTRPWADRLAAWLVGLLLGFLKGAAAAVPGLVAAVTIFVLARLAVRAVRAVLDRVERGQVEIPGLHPETVPATRSISTLLIWLFALTVAYPYLPGSQSDVFKGVSLFAGLMVTLGSSGVVAQWMSGMLLVYSRALRPGDFVQAGGVEGVVTALGLLSTKFRTPTGEEVTIPNAAVVGGAIRNHTRLSEGRGSRVSTAVTIGYDAAWRHVHAMLQEAAARTAGLRADPPPHVLQRALGDFCVEYELVARIDDPLARPEVITRLHGNVQDVFNENGVQIMSPHFVAQPEEPVLAAPEPRQTPAAAAARGAA